MWVAGDRDVVDEARDVVLVVLCAKAPVIAARAMRMKGLMVDAGPSTSTAVHNYPPLFPTCACKRFSNGRTRMAK